MSVDWTQLARSLNGQQLPALISDLVREKARPAVENAARESGPRLSMQELLAAPPPGRQALLLAHVQKSLAQVMALDAPELDPEESMSNLGLDSLMALELQHSLEESFGTKLPDRVCDPAAGHSGKACASFSVRGTRAGNDGQCDGAERDLPANRRGVKVTQASACGFSSLCQIQTPQPEACATTREYRILCNFH
jgi:acyl carrier protein